MAMNSLDFSLFHSPAQVMEFKKFKLRNRSNISSTLPKCGRMPLVLGNQISKNHLSLRLFNWCYDEKNDNLM